MQIRVVGIPLKVYTHVPDDHDSFLGLHPDPLAELPRAGPPRASAGPGADHFPGPSTYPSFSPSFPLPLPPYPLAHREAAQALGTGFLSPDPLARPSVKIRVSSNLSVADVPVNMLLLIFINI